MSKQARNVWNYAGTLPIGITQYPSNKSIVGFHMTEGTDKSYVWHGRIPDSTVDITDFVTERTYLPDDSADWTGGETTHAEAFVLAHGLEVTKGKPVDFDPPVKGLFYVYTAVSTDSTITYHG